jgi:hypothetical protein
MKEFLLFSLRIVVCGLLLGSSVNDFMNDRYISGGFGFSCWVIIIISTFMRMKVTVNINLDN